MYEAWRGNPNDPTFTILVPSGLWPSCKNPVQTCGDQDSQLAMQYSSTAVQQCVIRVLHSPCRNQGRGDSSKTGNADRQFGAPRGADK